MTKYKTGSRYDFAKIDAVKVISETAHFVLLAGETRREAKISDWHRYHDTWVEAHEYLLGRARRNLESAKANLLEAESQLNTVLNMVPTT